MSSTHISHTAVLQDLSSICKEEKEEQNKYFLDQLIILKTLFSGLLSFFFVAKKMLNIFFFDIKLYITP